MLKTVENTMYTWVYFNHICRLKTLYQMGKNCSVALSDISKNTVFWNSCFNISFVLVICFLYMDKWKSSYIFSQALYKNCIEFLFTRLLYFLKNKHKCTLIFCMVNIKNFKNEFQYFSKRLFSCKYKWYIW